MTWKFEGRVDAVEVVINEDGRKLWVHVKDGDDRTTPVQFADIANLHVLDDRFTYPLEDLIGYLTTELSELRLLCSQRGIGEHEKQTDARVGRRWNDAAVHRGREEVYNAIERRLAKIISEYGLDKKG